MNDPEGVAHVIAHSDTWFGIHFAIVIGISLMLGGLVALGRSITDGPAGALSRLGLFAGTVGIAIGLILVILDGVAAHQLAKQWASATAEQGVAPLGHQRVQPIEASAPKHWRSLRIVGKQRRPAPTKG